MLYSYIILWIDSNLTINDTSEFNHFDAPHVHLIIISSASQWWPCEHKKVASIVVSWNYYQLNNKNLCQWDWHISTHADLRPRAARFHERRISSVTFTSALLYGNVYKRVGVARAHADSSDFGLLEEQSSQKLEIPCLERRWTAEKSLTSQALSSAEKSVTVHINKQSNRYIRTFPIGMCG